MFYNPEYGLLGEIVYLGWKRMCVLLLISGMFYKCQLGQVSWSV